MTIRVLGAGATTTRRFCDIDGLCSVECPNQDAEYHEEFEIVPGCLFTGSNASAVV